MYAALELKPRHKFSPGMIKCNAGHDILNSSLLTEGYLEFILDPSSLDARDTSQLVLSTCVLPSHHSILLSACLVSFTDSPL